MDYGFLRRIACILLLWAAALVVLVFMERPGHPLSGETARLSAATLSARPAGAFFEDER